jgi:hypothetical protein
MRISIKNNRKHGLPFNLRIKEKQLDIKRDSRRVAELYELRKAVGKRKLKEIRNKLKDNRLTHKKKSQKTKKTKKKIKNKRRTIKLQKGGECSISTVDIPGFNIGPFSYSASEPAIEGISMASRRGSVYKNCTNGGKAPSHAMTGGSK